MKFQATPKSSVFQRSALVSLLLAALPLSSAWAMSKAENADARSRIESTYKTERAACNAMAHNAKDICIEEAKAKEKVALAEQEFAFTGTLSDQRKVGVAKAESAYAVAKERCDDKSGNDKDVCVKEAKAVETKALADLTLAKKVGEAVTEAKDDKRDANYKVAAEKCDAMAGTAKDNCVAEAKLKYGKS